MAHAVPPQSGSSDSALQLNVLAQMTPRKARGRKPLRPGHSAKSGTPGAAQAAGATEKAAAIPALQWRSSRGQRSILLVNGELGP